MSRRVHLPGGHMTCPECDGHGGSFLGYDACQNCGKWPDRPPTRDEKIEMIERTVETVLCDLRNGYDEAEHWLGELVFNLRRPVRTPEPGPDQGAG